MTSDESSLEEGASGTSTSLLWAVPHVPVGQWRHAHAHAHGWYGALGRRLVATAPVPRA